MKEAHTQRALNIRVEEIHLEQGEIVTITGDMIIGDVVLAYPETLPILKKIGIHCVGCYASTFESIQEGVARHGQDPAKICKKLNDQIKKTHVRGDTASTKSRSK